MGDLPHRRHPWPVSAELDGITGSKRGAEGTRRIAVGNRLIT
jgi:hypothetical protein